MGGKSMMVTGASQPVHRESRRPYGGSAACSIELLDTAVADLATVNCIVAEASRAWNLTPRLRRLAVPTLLYDEADLKQMSVALARSHDGPDVAVALWEESAAPKSPQGARAVLLHGLYVAAVAQHRGVGSSLLNFVEKWSASRQFARVELRAWRHADPFFIAHGYRPPAAHEQANLFPRRLRKSLK